MLLPIAAEEPLLRLIDAALREDVGNGDITSEAILPADLQLRGAISAKEDGLIAGLGVIEFLFAKCAKEVVVRFFATDGDRVRKGQKIAEFTGPGRILLTLERLTLNILQRMSGIATETNRYVERIRGTGAILLDTRKTAPGLRVLDKLAVKIGGGTNHRMGLFDSYLIKENHIEAAGGLGEAVKRIRANGSKKTIEIEVRSLTELREALTLPVDRILLDNMTLQEMRDAVKLAAGKIPLEASGNISLANVRDVAETGVNFISVGSLTHSVKALDLSLIIQKA